MLHLDSKNFVLIGGAAVAVIAGIYVIWGPSDNRKRRLNRRVTCPGLVNLGNSCFLNAILQALAPCCSVSQWLAVVVERRHRGLQYVTTALQNVIKVLNNDSIEFTEEYCPSDVMHALHTNGWVISSEEQDAHEMFHVLMETVTEETVPCTHVVPLFDVGSLEEMEVLPSSEAVNRVGAGLHQLSKFESEQPFRGLLASQLQCKRCGHKCAVKYDSFDSLSLSLPQQYSGCLTLDQLLRHFVMLESVDDVVCDKCCHPKLDGITKRTSSFVKKLTIGKLPCCLCIHIQRTVWLNSGIQVKRFDRVSFPELLDLSPYVYHEQNISKVRPKPVDNDSVVRLVGGRKAATNGFCHIRPTSRKNSLSVVKSSVSSPKMSIPYSEPVNMLKALNYHSRNGHTNGLYAVGYDAVVPGKRTNSSSHELRLLAAAYSAEGLAATARRTAYRLVSVVVHLGDVSSGHFITYRRAPSVNGRRFPDEWLYASDTLVKRASFSEVLSSDAYMLLYEKI
jgi:ubiquitin carboxyl-terminal hydrolase 30